MASSSSSSSSMDARRKRPRSPVYDYDHGEMKHLMSFARLAHATTTTTQPPSVYGHAHANSSPAPVVLPGMSELLKRTDPPIKPLRQRLSEQGDYNLMQRHAAAMPTVYAVPVAEVPSASTYQDVAVSETMTIDEEAEDKSPWPSAAQYHMLFANMAHGKIPIYELGVDPRGVPLHPEFIYSQPVSCMYFLKCKRLLGKGSFGFPRKKKPAECDAANASATDSKMLLGVKKLPASKVKKDSTKDFEWRKMSFVTGLPKKQPLVRYITATCYSRATDLCAKKKVFRMHAVMLADASGTGEQGEYVLVHIRAGGSKRVGLRTAPTEAENQTNESQQTNIKQSSPFGPSPTASSRPISPPTTSTQGPVSMNMATRNQVPHGAMVPPFHANRQPEPEPEREPEPEPEPLAALTPAPYYQPQYVQNMPHMPVPQQQQYPQYPQYSMPSSACPPRPVHQYAPPSTEAQMDPTVQNAKQMLRSMLLQNCGSREEVAKYVRALQEELAALQQQTQTTSRDQNM